MQELIQRATDCADQIRLIRDRQARRDLLRMLGAVDSALNQLDSESVECRRLKRTTARYDELKQKAQLLVENLEQHLTFARLRFG